MPLSGSRSDQPGWTSRFGFLMASIGFAVGLGNIWRFPYVTGENGGAAFVLVYLVCVVTIGIPILMAELLVGRRGRSSPPGALRHVAEESTASRHWGLVGGMNLFAAYLIMVTYSVVAGWVLAYLFSAVTTGFVDVNPEVALVAFNGVLQSVPEMLSWTLLALLVTGSIIYAGVQKGIERAVSILMPSLFVLMIVLVIYNFVVGGFGEAMAYLFSADFEKINAAVILAAIGQAFFSIGVAMAGMMTYGAYLPSNVSIPKSVVIIIFADTLVALLAGLVIFPAVFYNGLDPAGGSGLIFQTLPVAFAQMPGGHLVSVLFFLLLSVAAITSMVGLVEPLTHWMEESTQLTRHQSALAILGSIAVLSLFSVLGYNHLAEMQFYGKGLNAVLDYFSNQVLLPVGGLLIAIFVGWFVDREIAREELALADGALFKIWRFLLKFIVPPAVFVVFVLGVSW